MKSFLVFGFVCLVSMQVFAQKNIAALSFQLDWQLITNHHQQRNQNLSALRLTNTGKTIIPASGWSIYFNYDRGVEDALTTGNVSIKHLNGDLYRLQPKPGFSPIAPGGSVTVTYVSDGELRNFISAPRGIYYVLDSNPDQGIPITQYTRQPFQDTTAAWVTAADVYDRNKNIVDIPANTLTKVFPTPVQYQELPGVFGLHKQIPVSADPTFSQELQYLITALSPVIGGNLSTNKPVNEPRNISLRQSDMPKEAYTLSVTTDAITITAGDPAGAFYGIQSLLSLIPPQAWLGKTTDGLFLPCVEVADAPRFGYRSLSFDVARHFRDKKEIFRVLDLMATYKLNVLHFHLIEDEGWRVAIPGLPELTEVGARRGHTSDGKSMLPPAFGSGPIADASSGSGFYTRKDYIDILRYATERHIQVIPEIESPGHSRAAIKAMAARYDRLMAAGDKAGALKYLLHDFNDRSQYRSAQLWNDNIMCVALPSVYTFMEKVVDEFIAMYQEAGAPLETIHLGGDEVPAGAWEKSPVCLELIQRDPTLHNTDDLWYYFYGKLHDMLQRKGLYMSGWEEMAMRKTKRDGQPTMIPNPGFANKNIQVHVWNNVIGWGAEDLPYRLANAGFKVILSPVSNNYFDMSYYKHPEEPGLYWGGHQDIDKPFYFVPFDYYKTTKEGPDGNPIDPAVLVGKDRLTDFGRSNIVGIEGLIWSETLESDAALEYMLLPKLLGFAERAWAPDPDWAKQTNAASSKSMYEAAWARFVNVVGKRELPRLAKIFGGFAYRIPTPGIRQEAENLMMNIQFPGLEIRYTTDGSEPTTNSNLYTAPLKTSGTVKARAFDATGRGSRTVSIKIPRA
jgi:hexosaminidase